MHRLLTSFLLLLLIACKTDPAKNEHQPDPDSLATLNRQIEEQNNLLQRKRLKAILDERNNVLSNVTTGEPTFKSLFLGGFKNIRFNLYNRYSYPLEQVILKVHYIRANEKEIKTETIVVKDIPPGSGRELTASDYKAAGKSLTVTIESVLCRSISLCYYRDRPNTSPDPYHCE